MRGRGATRKRERERRLLGKGVYKSRIAGNP